MKDIKDRTPNHDTIRILERLLEDAKGGRLRTVIVIEGDDEDGWGTCFSLDQRNTARRMIGEVTLMYHQIVQRQLLVEDSPLSRAIYGD
jgi:hypothetical protein